MRLLDNGKRVIQFPAQRPPPLSSQLTPTILWPQAILSALHDLILLLALSARNT